MATILGIDFGTTNSVIAALDTGTRQLRTLRFAAGDGEQDVFRSLLCFWQDAAGGPSQLRHAAGPAAIETYLEDPLDSRLVMSLKSHLASRSFTGTTLMGRSWTLPALVGLFLRALLAAARLDPAGARVVAGRPVRFAGDGADDAFGEARLRAAFAEAGLPQIDVALEPEAAGYGFTRALAAPATVLVGDFGGGTSDFSVLRFDPAGTPRVTALGRAGVGIAGDAFDARIMDRVVAPLLGKGSCYAPWGTALPVPAEWYAAFARWHRLSLMRSPRTLRDIAEVRRTAEAPEQLDHLRQLVEDEQGYGLYRAGVRREGRAVGRGQHGAVVPPRRLRGGAGSDPARLRGLDRAGAAPRGRRRGRGAGGGGGGRGGPGVPDRGHVLRAGGAGAVRAAVRGGAGVGRRRVRIGGDGVGADRGGPYGVKLKRARR